MLVEAVKFNKNTGSSTATLARLDPDKGILYTTSLGDSSYRIFRKSDKIELFFATKEQ